MSTETIRRCDQCCAIISPALPHFMLDLTLVPMRDLVTLGGNRSAKGEFCGAECVKRAIGAALMSCREVVA